MAQIAALRASVDKIVLQLQSKGGRQIGGCYDDALVPAEFFSDDLAAFLGRENFAGTLNSASDKRTGRRSRCSKSILAARCRTMVLVSSCSRTTYMAKHVGALSKQNFDQLKAYTDAVLWRSFRPRMPTLAITAATTTWATKALKICTLRCTFLTRSCKGFARLGRGQARK